MPQFKRGTAAIVTRPQPVIKLTRANEMADNRSGHNSINNGSSPLTIGATYGDTTEYMAYWGNTGAPVIAWRTLPSGDWTTHVITDATVLATIGTAISDLHNTLSLAVDSVGRLHLCGNMHAIPMRAVRTVLANGDATGAWEVDTMIGTEETQVSYPTFVRMSDSTLLLIHRDGYSWGSKWCINRYNATTKVWTRLNAPHFLEGVLGAGAVAYLHPDSNGPYIGRPCPTPDGKLHIPIVWYPQFNRGTATVLVHSSMNGTLGSTLVGAQDVLFQGTTTTYLGAGWVTSTAYTTGQSLIRNGYLYECILNHTSGASTEPGVGASWQTNWSSNGFATSGTAVAFTSSGDQIAFNYTDLRTDRFKSATCIQGGTSAFSTSKNITADTKTSYVCLTGLQGSGTIGAQKADGTSLSLPITYTNVDVIYHSAFALQPSGCAVDSNGRPRILQTQRDTNNLSQNVLMHWDGAAWQRKSASSFDELDDPFLVELGHFQGGFEHSIARPALVNANGRDYCIWRSQWDGFRSSAWITDCTPGSQIVHAPLLGMDLWDWEPVIDYRACDERSELHLWVSPTFEENNAALTTPSWFFGDDMNWQYQMPGVLSVDNDRLPLVISRQAQVPKVEVIESNSTREQITVDADGAYHTLSPSGFLHLSQEHAGHLLFARFVARMTLTNASANATLKMSLAYTPTGFTDVASFLHDGTKLWLDGVAIGTRSVWAFTPWVPLRDVVAQSGKFRVDGEGYLYLQAICSSGSVSVVRSAIKLGWFPTTPLPRGLVV